MKKYIVLAIWMAALCTATYVLADNQKVPAEVGVQIRGVLLEQSRIQTQMLNLQSQYQGLQQQFVQKQTELDSLKSDALGAAKLDPKVYDVDVEKLEFAPKTKPESKAPSLPQTSDHPPVAPGKS